jgi:hypothetical protein
MDILFFSTMGFFLVAVLGGQVIRRTINKKFREKLHLFHRSRAWMHRILSESCIPDEDKWQIYKIYLKDKEHFKEPVKYVLKCTNGIHLSEESKQRIIEGLCE